MSQIHVNNLPKLTLTGLLRRRRMSLHQFMTEYGLSTYEGLLTRCQRLGVLPPNEDEFRVGFPQASVNSPQEGVVVIEPVVTDDTSSISVELTAHPSEDELWADSLDKNTETSQKRQRKKKVEP